MLAARRTRNVSGLVAAKLCNHAYDSDCLNEGVPKDGLELFRIPL